LRIFSFPLTPCFWPFPIWHVNCCLSVYENAIIFCLDPLRMCVVGTG
jgi:hypothetical protein